MDILISASIKHQKLLLDPSVNNAGIIWWFFVHDPQVVGFPHHCYVLSIFTMDGEMRHSWYSIPANIPYIIFGYFWVFETNIFHYDRILDYFSWFSTILGDWNQCISLHLPRFCCFTPWMVLRKKKRVFPGHGVTPSHHPVQVMDDHDLVLKQPWWRLGIPHDWRNPHIIIHHHFLPVLIMIFSIKSHNKWNLQMT
jgi:hypothetical protein